MKLSLREPISALITPAGTAAINVIRISGEGAIPVVARYFRPADKLLSAPGHSIVYGIFYDEAARPLDEVLCSVFKAPKSYTGDDTVEISCHGNPRLAARILEQLLLHSRMANPGEFTMRAMYNNKLDLIQAEAINDLITGPSSKSQSAALSQLRGVLSAKMNEFIQRITHLRIQCELAIDFADQDLPSFDEAAVVHDLTQLQDEMAQLCDQSQQARFIRDGIRICLAGAPNSGKSSLFNAFLNQNRAIVSPHPGTTRDYLEESISLQGYTIVLFDTAGLRESQDTIEQEGIDRSQQLMQDADLILYLIDAQTHAGELDMSALDSSLHSKTLVVLSKADLATPAAISTLQDALAPLTVSSSSVVADDGLQSLFTAILSRFKLLEPQFERPLVTNVRHLAALKKSRQSLGKALSALQDGMGYEFAAFDLIEASTALEQILGIITPDDLLNSIFADFCIGK